MSIYYNKKGFCRIALNYGEVVLFDYPRMPGDQGVNSVDMSIEEIKATPEYSIVKSILQTAQTSVAK